MTTDGTGEDKSENAKSLNPLFLVFLNAGQASYCVLAASAT